MWVGVKGGEDGMGWTRKREEEGCGTSQGVLEGGGKRYGWYGRESQATYYVISFKMF